MDNARYAIQEISGSLETNATLWKKCRNPDITKKIQLFLFKTLHNTHCIGDFWLRVRNFEERAQCSTCGATIESMKHILTECDNTARTTIWDAAKSIWPAKHGDWPAISMGLILGCGSIHFPHTPDNDDLNNQQKVNTKCGASHLLRILISKSAYLIWTLRCEHTIHGTSHSLDNITKRWLNTLSQRLQIDCTITTKNHRTGKMTNLIHSMWTNIVNQNNPLHKNWVTTPEVLVGITLPRPHRPG